MSLRGTPPHLKSMGSYEMFARDDALWIASFLAENCPLVEARELFEAKDQESLRGFEEKYRTLISDFIGKTASQRGAFFRKISKEADTSTKVTFLTLAMIALVQVERTLEIRDRYRSVLAPGRGNRLTVEALYACLVMRSRKLLMTTRGLSSCSMP